MKKSIIFTSIALLLGSAFLNIERPKINKIERKTTTKIFIDKMSVESLDPMQPAFDLFYSDASLFDRISFTDSVAQKLDERMITKNPGFVVDLYQKSEMPVQKQIGDKVLELMLNHGKAIGYKIDWEFHEGMWRYTDFDIRGTEFTKNIKITRIAFERAREIYSTATGNRIHFGGRNYTKKEFGAKAIDGTSSLFYWLGTGGLNSFFKKKYVEPTDLKTANIAISELIDMQQSMLAEYNALPEEERTKLDAIQTIRNNSAHCYREIYHSIQSLTTSYETAFWIGNKEGIKMINDCLMSFDWTILPSEDNEWYEDIFLCPRDDRMRHPYHPKVRAAVRDELKRRGYNFTLPAEIINAPDYKRVTLAEKHPDLL